MSAFARTTLRHGRACPACEAEAPSARRRPGHPRLSTLAATAILLLTTSPHSAQAQSAAHFSPFFRFTEQSGEQLFANVCQGCHMGDARGAEGAGSYPSLVQNANLIAGGYPVTVVVRGQRAMPAFGAMMSDDQIAAVVNYLRTHFGNNYTDAVTAEDVKAARP